MHEPEPSQRSCQFWISFLNMIQMEMWSIWQLLLDWLSLNFSSLNIYKLLFSNLKTHPNIVYWRLLDIWYRTALFLWSFWSTRKFAVNHWTDFLGGENKLCPVFTNLKLKFIKSLSSFVLWTISGQRNGVFLHKLHTQRTFHL